MQSYFFFCRRACGGASSAALFGLVRAAALFPRLDRAAQWYGVAFREKLKYLLITIFLSVATTSVGPFDVDLHDYIINDKREVGGGFRLPSFKLKPGVSMPQIVSTVLI